MASEREVKFEVDLDFRLPDLEGVAGVAVRPASELLLEATYYDTRRLDLARWGVTIRYRGSPGSSGKWTVKLPSEPGQTRGLLSRAEIDFQGSPEMIPPGALELVRDFTRGRRLREISRLTTSRRRYELLRQDVQDTQHAQDVYAELDDDGVEYETAGGATGRFREVEVELSEGSDESLLPGLAKALKDAGARPGDGEPKVLRTIGWQAPPMPPQSLDETSTIAELTSYAIATSVRRLLDHLPFVRTTEDQEAVHQSRVAARRLRSDLSTLEDVIKRKPQKRMRSGLRELGRSLGSLRDADVMAATLANSIAKLSDGDQRAAGVYIDRIGHERQVQRSRVLDYINSPSFVAEVDRLVEAIDGPPARKPRARAAKVLPPLVARRWRRLSRRVDRLGDAPSDHDLHRVRIDAKRCRYAAELAAPVVGKDASRLAEALADVQTALGDLQDTVVLESWLREAQTGVSPAQAGVASALIEEERRRADAARSEWEGAWRTITDKRLADWLA